MSTNGELRAVVADDSQFMRQMISDILEAGGITVVAQASDGEDALRAVGATDPDVVTMDIQMPVMDGVEATARIMDEHPTPILVLSAHAQESADVTFEALDNGAVDFFAKPGGEVSTEMQRHREKLVKHVKAVAEAEVSSQPASPTDSVRSDSPGPATTQSDATLIVGASTGGPTVVEELISSLPASLGLRILIVQHMPPGFTNRFADRLDASSDYTVWEAEDGDRVGAGEAVVAPGDHHLEVTTYRAGRLRLNLTNEPPVHGVRPAVDVTLSSAAETIEDQLIGVILTGMGRDGAEGVSAIAASGGYVVAQDEASSAVFGMPKQAIATGSVEAVLPVEEIPGHIQSFTETEATA